MYYYTHNFIHQSDSRILKKTQYTKYNMKQAAFPADSL